MINYEKLSLWPRWRKNKDRVLPVLPVEVQQPPLRLSAAAAAVTNVRAVAAGEVQERKNQKKEKKKKRFLGRLNLSGA